MRIILAAAFFAAACATTAPADPVPPPAPSASSAYQDARSVASEADIRTSRRAYRAACQQRYAAEHCECMTGSMAQTLAPPDLDIAAARFGGATAANARVDAAQASAEAACASVAR